MKATRFFMLTMLMMVSLCANASFYVNGIKYESNGKGTCKVEMRADTDPKYSGDIIIPDHVITHDSSSGAALTYTVTEIAARAFNGCTEITSIVLPSSICTIDGEAFYNCSGFKSIVIPNSVTTIGPGAFELCM